MPAQHDVTVGRVERHAGGLLEPTVGQHHGYATGQRAGNAFAGDEGQEREAFRVLGLQAFDQIAVTQIFGNASTTP